MSVLCLCIEERSEKLEVNVRVWLVLHSLPCAWELQSQTEPISMMGVVSGITDVYKISHRRFLATNMCPTVKGAAKWKMSGKLHKFFRIALRIYDCLDCSICYVACHQVFGNVSIP